MTSRVDGVNIAGKASADHSAVAPGGTIDAYVVGEKARQYLDHWRSVQREGGALPSPWRMRPWLNWSHWPNLVTIKVIGGGADFQILRVGYEVQYRSGRRHEGGLFSQLPGMGPGGKIWRNYQRLLQMRLPYTSDAPYAGPHEDILEVRETLFPFGRRDGVVTHIAAIVEYYFHGVGPKINEHRFPQFNLLTGR